MTKIIDDLLLLAKADTGEMAALLWRRLT